MRRDASPTACHVQLSSFRPPTPAELAEKIFAAEPFVSEPDRLSQTFSLAPEDNLNSTVTSTAHVVLLTDCCERTGPW
jgi:hypothetical protein